MTGPVKEDQLPSWQIILFGVLGILAVLGLVYIPPDASAQAPVVKAQSGSCHDYMVDATGLVVTVPSDIPVEIRCATKMRSSSGPERSVYLVPDEDVVTPVLCAVCYGDAPLQNGHRQ